MHLWLHFMQVINPPSMFLLTLQFSDLLWFGSPRNRRGQARPPRSPPLCWSWWWCTPSSPCSSRCWPPPPTAAATVASACSGPNHLQPQGPTCPHHSPRPWKITFNWWDMVEFQLLFLDLKSYWSCFGPSGLFNCWLSQYALYATTVIK